MYNLKVNVQNIIRQNELQLTYTLLPISYRRNSGVDPPRRHKHIINFGTIVSRPTDGRGEYS